MLLFDPCMCMSIASVACSSLHLSIGVVLVAFDICSLFHFSLHGFLSSLYIDCSRCAGVFRPRDQHHGRAGLCPRKFHSTALSVLHEGNDGTQTGMRHRIGQCLLALPQTFSFVTTTRQNTFFIPSILIASYSFLLPSLCARLFVPFYN